MTPRKWILLFFWGGILLMVMGQFTVLTLQPQFGQHLGDLENVFWWAIDSAQRFAVPIGIAFFVSSFLVRALVPVEHRDGLRQKPRQGEPVS